MGRPGTRMACNVGQEEVLPDVRGEVLVGRPCGPQDEQPTHTLIQYMVFVVVMYRPGSRCGPRVGVQELPR